MPLFRRRRDDDDVDDQVESDELAPDDAAAGADAEAGPVGRSRPGGPWDVADVDDEVQRVDLGSLQVPVPDGC